MATEPQVIQSPRASELVLRCHGCGEPMRVPLCQRAHPMQCTDCQADAQETDEWV